MELDFQSIFKELNELKVDYLVVGGLAVNFHGVPRMTYDIDLMILLQPENISKLGTKLSDWGYRPKVPINPMELANEMKRNSWIQEKKMRAVNFYNETSPIGEIDIVFDSPIPYDELKSRAVMIEIQGEKIPTVSIHDLIKLKQQSGRKQDIADAEYLKMILGEMMETQKKGFTPLEEATDKVKDNPIKEKSLTGFTYTVSSEQLDEYRKWPIERRLKWLYFANKMRKGLPKKTIEIQELFRRGEI